LSFRRFVMILVFAEHRDGAIRKPTYEALLVGYEIARKSSDELAAVVIGSEIASLAGEVALFGVKKVFTVDNANLSSYTPDGYVTALADVVRKHSPSHVVVSATATGKDLAASLGARLETQVLPDVTAIEFPDDGKLVAVRPIYAGKALSRVRAPQANPLVVSVRPRAVDPLKETDTEGAIVAEDVEPERLRAHVAEIVKAVSTTVELTEADIIVSGGRGMKGPENYGLIEDLARTINAAVGASRAAVDAGWRDHQDQVGQTGKIVAPTVYIACGISGAIQHLVGMSNSKCIVAINKDPEANIFKVADYGIVGDLFKVVPLLTEEFKKLKSGQAG
jgi:electron transfer flavoprotein alpha subunit